VQVWEYDKELYKKRNEVERFFCRYDRYRVDLLHFRSDINHAKNWASLL
jgi:transposase